MKNLLKKSFSNIRFAFLAIKVIGIYITFVLGGILTQKIEGGMSYMGAMLASISLIVVLEEDIDTTIKKGWLRVLGSFIGAFVAYVYLSFFPFSIHGMIICICLLMIICMALYIPDIGRIATVMLIWVLLRSLYTDLSPFMNGLMRVVESFVGSAMGIGLGWILIKIKNELNRNS